MKTNFIFTSLGVLAIFASMCSASTVSQSKNIQICKKLSDYSSLNYLYSIGQKLLDYTAFQKYEKLNEADVRGIRDLSSRLLAHGIRLVLVPVPDSAMLYTNVIGNPFPQNYDPKVATQAYNDWIQGANSAGLTVVDVTKIVTSLAAKGIAYFPNYDHHWSGKASNETASATAKSIESLRLKLDRTPDIKINVENKPFKGSYAKLLEKECGTTALLPETRDFYSIKIKSQASLLTTTYPDVVVVADSFSDPQYSFVQSLSYYLKNNVQDQGVGGGGPVSSIANFLNNMDSKHPPKVLVWIGRDLTLSESTTRELIPSLEQNFSIGKAVFSKTIPFPIVNNTDVEKDPIIPVDLKLDRNLKYRVEITTKGPKVDQMLFRANLSDRNIERFFIRVPQNIVPFWKIKFSYDISGSDGIKTLSIGPRYVTTLPKDSSVDIRIFPY